MQRMTRQRQAVLEELEDLDDFRSAQQIYEHLHRSGHKVGLATVYRNLQSLTEAGEVDVLRAADGECLYRLCGDRGHHHHLVCRNCGHTEEVAPREFETWVTEVAAEHGYTAVEHSIVIFGLCAECTAEAASQDATPTDTTVAATTAASPATV